MKLEMRSLGVRGLEVRRFGKCLIGWGLFLFFNSLALHAQQPLDHIIDMVHHNPGEAQYASRFERPDVLRDMGYHAKSYFLFDSPTLAINWDGFDVRIMPDGSPQREWVTKKAARLHGLFNECKRQGLAVYAMSDLVLLPKELVRLYGIEHTFGDPTDTLTQRILRYQMQQIFHQFPQMDGLIVRIGETYLQDAPYHQGSILNKKDADRCIIPLLQLLREEVCERQNKKLIFRTWWSFDVDLDTYLAVTDAVAPHPNLIISVKHCENDFHRGHPFSKVLGMGRHQQLVEVQCAREYEGKGAFPNYIARGVIDGFEEDALLKRDGKPWNLRDIYRMGRLSGLWTWSRGGGWEGPYPKNELWCEMNAWVLAQWASHPEQSERALFNRYCHERLRMDNANAQRMRQIAELSEHAVIRGLSSVVYPKEMKTTWVRDEYISFPRLPQDTTKAKTILQEKDEAVEDWRSIAAQAQKIHTPDSLDEQFIRVSCEYGLQMFRIFRAVYHLAGIRQHLFTENPQAYIAEYDEAWLLLRRLSEDHPMVCPSLFSRTISRRTGTAADSIINEMRE